jgi:hypothetical protein
MKTNLLICAALALANFSAVAAPLTESTFTEIIRDVNTLSTAGNPSSAKLNDVLKAPDRVRTGPESRAELTAADSTITRVGANTVFSFSDSGRTLNLEQGSLLFHAPKGIGGGTIKSGGASAAVLGTTLIVAATVDGGFKVILVEGSGKVTLPNGKTVTLKAGQMVFILPGGGGLSEVIDINLGRLASGSGLINGFARPLPSAPLIQAAVDGQNAKLASGDAVDTGETPKKFRKGQPPQGNGLGTVDPGTYQNAAHPPVTTKQFGKLFSNNPAVNGFTGTPGGRGVSTVGF